MEIEIENLISSLGIKILELAEMIRYSDRINFNVSAKGVDWHIDHSLKVIVNSCEGLKKSDPSTYIMEDNTTRDRIFKTGSILRGVAKAPKAATAEGAVQIAELRNQVILAKKQIDEMQSISENSHFMHPYFGSLNLKLAIQFLCIHTDHHLKIMHDIIDENRMIEISLKSPVGSRKVN